MNVSMRSDSFSLVVCSATSILGDLKYRISDKHKNNNSQLMLHAYKINFTINELKYNFLAELPIIFRSTLNEKYLKIS